jgi:hypothetical protein
MTRCEVSRESGQWRSFFVPDQGDEQGYGVCREASWCQSQTGVLNETRYHLSYVGYVEKVGKKFLPHSYEWEVLEDSPNCRREHLRINEFRHPYESLEEAVDAIADRVMTILPNPFKI